MLTVGLTGGIGSGKSTVGAMLADRGGVLVDADRIVHDLQEPGTDVFAAIIERFGPAVRRPDGTLDRPALATVVFNDAEARADLNKIVHPAVGKIIAERLAAESTTDHVVVLDVPLLVESGRDDMAGVIVVDCPPDIAVRRLVEQRGMSEEDARARMAVQVSREERLAKANFVIDNSGPPDALANQVAAAWEWISSLRR